MLDTLGTLAMSATLCTGTMTRGSGARASGCCGSS
jgi:hypothetical protein